MKKSALTATAIAVFALTGCSTQSANHNAEVAALISVSAPPLFPGQAANVTEYATTLKTTNLSTRTDPFMYVRSCVDAKTGCQLGVAKLQSKITLVALNKDSATVHVNLDLDINRKQELTLNSASTSVSLPDDAAVLSAHFRSADTFVFKYDTVGRIELPYGVTYKLCVKAPKANQVAAGTSCVGQEVLVSQQVK